MRPMTPMPQFSFGAKAPGADFSGLNSDLDWIAKQRQAPQPPMGGSIPDPSGQGWQTTWAREPQTNPLLRLFQLPPGQAGQGAPTGPVGAMGGGAMPPWIEMLMGRP